MYRSPDSSSTPSREYVVLCIRDKFTGLFAAHPCTDRSTESVVVALRKFVGKKVASKTVSLLSDAAETFEAAAKELGWIPCPSLPNRFPHNSQLEREIRSFEEGGRTVFLNAGFSIRPQLWPAACMYGAMALNLTYAAPQDKDLTRWDFAVAHLDYDDIPPIKCVLGQLVFYRSKIGDKFAPNAAPGLFAGWRLEPGCSYKGLGLVLGLAKLKNRTGAWTDPLPAPEQEIYVKDEAPGFPLKGAAEIALSPLGFDEVVMPDPLSLPFSTADVIRKKVRRVYITYARFLELGPTPGCSACENDCSNHSAECIARFEAAYGGDREAPPTPALRRISPTPSIPPPTVEEARSGRFEVGPHLDFAEQARAEHELPSAGSRDPHPHAVEGADDIPSMAELFGSDDEDVAPAVAAPRHRHQLPGALILDKFACDANSMLGKVGADCGVQVVRLCSRDIGLSDNKAIDQLLDQVQATPGASIHCAIECARWSSWQNMNIATRGPAFQRALEAKRVESRRMLMAFIRVAAMIYHMRGEISFEWPRYASGWTPPEMVALIEQFGLIDALCDGCAFGLVSKDNLPL